MASSSGKKGTIGKMFFEVGDDASPTGYTRICPVFSISGFGKTRQLEDVSTFCSEGEVEYIAGRNDGNDVDIELNYIGDDDDVEDLIDFCDEGASGPFRLVNENVTPSKYLAATLVGMKWDIRPKVEGKNSLALGFKISGGIERGSLS